MSLSSLFSRENYESWTLRVASHIDEIYSAWRLVYREYRSFGFIDENKYKIITPQHFSHDSLVVLTSIYHVAISTLTCTLDSNHGLTLDTVFKDRIDLLRNDNRSVAEIGLFASVKGHEAYQSLARDLLEMMRYAYYYLRMQKVDDLVVGVHPDHALFYQDVFSMDIFSDERSYARYRDNPVVLMRIGLRNWNRQDHPVGKYYKNNPIPANQYKDRYDFNDAEVQDSAIGKFMSF